MRIPSESIRYGRNADNEDSYVSCTRCGFINNINWRTQGTARMGWGLIQPDTLLDGTVTVGDATITVDSTTGFVTPVTDSITAFAAIDTNYSKGTIVTSTAHGLQGGKIVITGTTNYNGTFYISHVLTDSFDIKAPYVADDATGTWTVLQYIYIYDAGSYETTGDVSSTYTDATGAPYVNKVSYTGLSSTTFTGCSNATAHDNDMVVRGDQTSSGCSYCGTYLYNR